jgi:glycosyltransferase involved in cell wall biosynthesis
MFAIIIPTWNNLDYLKLCVASIYKNSTYDHQIILHINDGSDGTLDWAQTAQIDFTHSSDNIGICKAVNIAAAKAKMPYVVYMNDDMYVCPGWDKEIMDRIKQLNSDLFLISATMIEPIDTGNPCVVHADFGQSINTFKEQPLIDNLALLKRSDWQGSAWPPTIVAKKYWDMVGGYSVEFSPGYSSDDDFAMKMWHIGCRLFLGIGNSLVYHFQAKSTQRIIKNDGRKQFRMKWGINQSTLNRHIIKRGAPFNGPLPEVSEKLMRKERRRAWWKLLKF